MHLVQGNTVSETILKSLRLIRDEGHYRASRNGGCTSVFDTTLEIKNPRARHLNLPGRKSNIFALIAETLWVFSGEDAVDPYLSFFLPRAPQYSDDGVVWHGAYGPRLYHENQLKSMVDLFRVDGLFTRRAFAAIHDPNLDSSEAIEALYGKGQLGKDRPCNLGINFYVEGENQFCTKVIQRSGDIIFGTGSINPFEFSFLHELMFNEVKNMYPELTLGPYRWHVTNMHLYDFTKSQSDSVLANFPDGEVFDFSSQDSIPLYGPPVGQWQNFFKDIVGQLTEAIITDDPQYVCDTLIPHMGHTFIEYEVPFEENILWTYVVLVARYIAQRRGALIEGDVDLSQAPSEFRDSIMNSTFLKFNVRA